MNSKLTTLYLGNNFKFWRIKSAVCHVLTVRRRRAGFRVGLVHIRSFEVFVNASSRQQDAFLHLQSVGTRLFPLHDVQARWSSMFLMLRPARRISKIIDKYCRDYKYSQFKVTDVEWRQIGYLVRLTKGQTRYWWLQCCYVYVENADNSNMKILFTEFSNRDSNNFSESKKSRAESLDLL